MQYVLNMQACKMCIYQRIPYFIAIIIGLIALLIKKYKYALLLLSLVFFANAIFAFYHMGVEYGWFKNIFGCQAAILSDNIEKLRQNILNSQAFDCSKPQFSFILTLAGWNFIICFIVGILCLLYYNKTNRE